MTEEKHRRPTLEQLYSKWSNHLRRLLMQLNVTWHTGTFVTRLSLLDAGASILAGWRVAGEVAALTVLAYVVRWALTSVVADLVDAHPAVLAGRWLYVALVDILCAGHSSEEGRAGADVLEFNDGALSTVGTWIRGTGVGSFTLLTWRHKDIVWKIKHIARHRFLGFHNLKMTHKQRVLLLLSSYLVSNLIYHQPTIGSIS